MADSLELRVRRLEDRAAIEELQANYCHAIDKVIPELFEKLWTSDAVWEFPPPMGRYEGLDRIMAVHGELGIQSPRTHHVTCDIVFLSLSDDEAVTRSDCVAQAGPPTGPLGAVGYADYQDRIKKVDGVWKFTERIARVYTEVIIKPNEVLA